MNAARPFAAVAVAALLAAGCGSGSSSSVAGLIPGMNACMRAHGAVAVEHHGGGWLATFRHGMVSYSANGKAPVGVGGLTVKPPPGSGHDAKGLALISMGRDANAAVAACRAKTHT